MNLERDKAKSFSFSLDYALQTESWETDMVNFLPSAGLLSVILYLNCSLQGQWSVPAFHCPILITRNCTGGNIYFLLPFSVFHWGSNQRQINKRKANKYINIYISCILVRNAGMTNSRRKLKFGFTDYLSQRTIYFSVSNKTEE